MEYGAIDLHSKESEIRIVTAEGEVVVHRRIATRRDVLTTVFGERPRMRLLLESGTESEWVAQHLESLGHEVVVADPNYAAMYAHRGRGIKTDRRDVLALVEANRRGIYRPAHRVSAAQRTVRRHLQVRDQLVRMRTQLINVMRGQLRSEGLRVCSGRAESFDTLTSRWMYRRRCRGARAAGPRAGRAGARDRSGRCLGTRDGARRHGRAPIDDGARRRPDHRAQFSIDGR
jgi:hypothetical protein